MLFTVAVPAIERKHIHASCKHLSHSLKSIQSCLSQFCLPNQSSGKLKEYGTSFASTIPEMARRLKEKDAEAAKKADADQKKQLLEEVRLKKAGA